MSGSNDDDDDVASSSTDAMMSAGAVVGPPRDEGSLDDRSSPSGPAESMPATTIRSPRLTNPSACIPRCELYELPNVITMDESESLVKEIDCQFHGVVWRPEGYDRRHRVQRYPSSSAAAAGGEGEEREGGLEGESERERRDDDVDVERSFGWIFDRIANLSSSSYDSSPYPSHHRPPMPMHRPSEVVVIEHTPTSCRSVVRTFERNAICSCRRVGGGGDGVDRGCDGGGGDNDPVVVDVGDRHDASSPSSCDCYVAQLTLLVDAIQTIDKPARRDPECWEIAEPTEMHETGYVMERNGVVVRRGDCLWSWRGCITDIVHDDGGRRASSSSADELRMSTSSDVGDTTTMTATAKKKKGTPWTRTAKLNASGRRCITIAFLGMRPPSMPNIVVDDAPPPGGGIMITPRPTIPTMNGETTNTTPPTAPLLPPLSTLLTIVVTTSPIRSHPSTELLERTFDTFAYAGEEFAYECRKVVICDGYRVLDEDGGECDGEDDDREEKKDENSTDTKTTTTTASGGVRGNNRITQKYANTKQNLRNGIATVDQARKYDEFKTRLRELCDAANADDDGGYNDDHDRPWSTGTTTSGATKRRSPFRKASVVELDERHGYGFALRHALYHHVHTPYVCVIQHDRTFMRPVPAREVVAAMSNDPMRRIKYVGMSMRSNLMYHDIFSGKFGRRATEEIKTMILRPPELCIGGGVFGPDGTSVGDMLPPCSEKRRILLEELKKTYRGSHQYIVQEEWLQSRRERMSSEGREQGREEERFHQLSLTPVLFWYDNTHIAETSHYRDFVFHPQYKMVARGGFVEDKLSPCLLRSCERLGLTEGHSRFGCYLLDDHSGVVFTGHLDGGSFSTADLHVNRDK